MFTLQQETVLRNDLNLVRKTQILQGAQPIEIVKDGTHRQ